MQQAVSSPVLSSEKSSDLRERQKTFFSRIKKPTEEECSLPEWFKENGGAYRQGKYENSRNVWTKYCRKYELILGSRCKNDTRGLWHAERIHKNDSRSILIWLVSQRCFRNFGKVTAEADEKSLTWTLPRQRFRYELNFSYSTWKRCSNCTLYLKCFQ